MGRLSHRVWRFVAALARRFERAPGPGARRGRAVTGGDDDQHRRPGPRSADNAGDHDEMVARLDRAMEEMARQDRLARRAATMAEEATRRGDAAKAAEYTTAAQSFATQRAATEREAASLRQLLAPPTGAAGAGD